MAHGRILGALSGKKKRAAVVLASTVRRRFGELLHHVRDRVAHDRDAMGEMLSTEITGVTEIGKAIVGQRRHGIAVAFSQCLQGRGIPRADGQNRITAWVLRLLASRRLRCLGYNDMGVGAADAEGTDPAGPFAPALGPWAQFERNIKRGLLPVERWIGGIEVQMRRNLTMLYLKYQLHQAGNTCCRFKMADIRFD